jgi:hypothetical protein
MVALRRDVLSKPAQGGREFVREAFSAEEVVDVIDRRVDGQRPARVLRLE